MTTTTTTVPRRTVARRFAVHYLQMVVAMAVGMVALGPVWSLLFDALGRPDVLAGTEVGALVMATDMTLAMSAWMRFRGHGWRPITEMGLAMYVPFLVLFPPLWAGAIGEHTLHVAGHALMLPAMALAMLLRLDEYTHAHH